LTARKRGRDSAVRLSEGPAIQTMNSPRCSRKKSPRSSGAKSKGKYDSRPTTCIEGQRSPLPPVILSQRFAVTCREPVIDQATLRNRYLRLPSAPSGPCRHREHESLRQYVKPDPAVDRILLELVRDDVVVDKKNAFGGIFFLEAFTTRTLMIIDCFLA
jgi:hypothetical protein